tara:strand:- start:425 stop:601 length:177 start_codon:yes stop_codon:yes gene_type:complete
MIRYRVIEKQIVTDGMTANEAAEALMALQDSDPEKSFDIEEYNFAPEGKRLGRDPDLH